MSANRSYTPPQARRTQRPLSSALISAVIFSLTFGCADIGGVDEGDPFETKSFGASANIYYDCKTSTRSPDGAQWSYHTKEVMNLMGSVSVHVTRDTDDFGYVTLSKVDTDTFSDGNVTLRLVQLGAHKSIEIQHKRVDLFASAENGRCEMDDRNGQLPPDEDTRVEPSMPAPSGPLNVPYYYQFHNQYAPSSSCQNTSVAMLLNFVGVNVTPDDITRRFGKDLAQSVGGLKQVFNTYAREYGARQLSSTSQGSFGALKAALDSGSPVIIHGMFTAAGHVVVVTGYTSDGYYVNDPAGAWSERFMGGYPGSSSTAGRGIFYSKRAFEVAVGTLNGSTFEPLWMHTL